MFRNELASLPLNYCFWFGCVVTIGFELEDFNCVMCLIKLVCLCVCFAIDKIKSCFG